MKIEYNSQNFTQKLGCIQWLLIIGMIAWIYPTYKRTKEIDKKLDKISTQIQSIEKTLSVKPDTTLKPFVGQK